MRMGRVGGESLEGSEVWMIGEQRGREVAHGIRKCSGKDR